MSQTMRPVQTTGDPESPIASVQSPLPAPLPAEALVRVAATSLNPGELRRARKRGGGEPIGWDFAGVVEQAATDVSGPSKGTRVIGFVANGAWAEYVAAQTGQLGVLPDAISFNAPATEAIAARADRQLAGKVVVRLA
jgi:NADPH:quinone reductase-like Zn-dependent oxidoreductase